MAKKDPHLARSKNVVQSQSANFFDSYILQPNTSLSVLHGLFPEVEKKASSKVDDKKASFEGGIDLSCDLSINYLKVKLLIERLKAAGIANAGEKDVAKALNTEFGGGDPEKAYDLLVIAQESKEGIIREIDPGVKMLGAVNRKGVSCFLDAVLFAMFARLPSFEAILYTNFDDKPRKNLGIKLRLWVNLLRRGKLITPDITKQLQDQIAACGWTDAGEIHQQDASEAFSFITGTLALPMLTLKMDLYHLGKEDAGDDHKFVNERLLEVAVPEPPADGRPITLEDCLEAYFNNKVEVSRYLERRHTLPSTTPQTPRDPEKARLAKIEIAQLRGSEPSSPVSARPPGYPPSPSWSGRPRNRPRGSSLIQEHYVFEKTDSQDSKSDATVDGPTGRRRAGSLRKAVMMPAWQFFSLIPWYTDSSNGAAPNNDAQVAAHFSRTRPILGICLKRYLVDNKGRAKRLDTHIDIPLEIALPHFIQDDAMAEHGPAMGNFKLSLQSIVCHRGTSVDSGHYLSAVRYPSTAKNRESGSPTPPDQWLRHDDLARERVVRVNVEQFLRHESPYLLFYQVQPIGSDAGNVSEFTEDPRLAGNPPSYAESLDQSSTGPAISVKTDSGFSEAFQPVPEGLHSTSEGLQADTLDPNGDRFRPSGEFKRGRFGMLTRTSSSEPSGNDDNGSGRRLSASFSRMANRMNTSRPTSMISSSNPDVAIGPIAPPADEQPHIQPSTPQLYEASTKRTESDGGKLKKEPKDKGKVKGGHHQQQQQQHHILAGGRHHKQEKPDRECRVM